MRSGQFPVHAAAGYQPTQSCRGKPHPATAPIPAPPEGIGLDASKASQARQAAQDGDLGLMKSAVVNNTVRSRPLRRRRRSSRRAPPPSAAGPGHGQGARFVPRRPSAFDRDGGKPHLVAVGSSGETAPWPPTPTSRSRGPSSGKRGPPDTNARPDPAAPPRDLSADVSPCPSTTPPTTSCTGPDGAADANTKPGPATTNNEATTQSRSRIALSAVAVLRRRGRVHTGPHSSDRTALAYRACRRTNYSSPVPAMTFVTRATDAAHGRFFRVSPLCDLSLLDSFTVSSQVL